MMTIVSDTPRSITLPNPDLLDNRGFDNRIRFFVNLIGEPHTIVRSPTYEVISLVWSALRRAKAEELMDFLITEAGKYVTLTLHDATQYYGNITAEEPSMQSVGRGLSSTLTKETMTISLIFKGNTL